MMVFDVDVKTPPEPEWRNWQTRQLEGLVRLISGAGSSPVSGSPNEKSRHLRNAPTPLAEISAVQRACALGRGSGDRRRGGVACAKCPRAAHRRQGDQGAIVYYNWQCKDGVPISNGQPWWPRWLLAWVGVDYFYHPGFVAARSGTEAELFHIGKLWQLEGLELVETGVTDSGLAQLKGLTQLRTLNLDMTAITDAGLVHLKGLSSLRCLMLSGAITDAGLAQLATGHLDRLERLELTESQVNDAGLEHLKSLPSLRELSLDDTEVTCAGLVHLKGLTKLRHLNLGNTAISDAGLSVLKGMANLTWLSLEHTSVTDAGLANLRRLSKLRTLLVADSEITQSGLAELQEAVRDLRTRRDLTDE